MEQGEGSGSLGSLEQLAAEPEITLGKRRAERDPVDVAKEKARHAPKSEVRITDEWQRNYNIRRKEAETSYRDYCKRIYQLREMLNVHTETDFLRDGGLKVLTLSKECRLRGEEIAACHQATISEKDAVAQLFQKRSPDKWAPKAKNFEIRSHDGEIMVTVLKNIIPYHLTIAFEHVEKRHREVGVPWTQGCEVRG